MRSKWLVITCIGVLCLGLAAFAWAMTPTPAAAQCGSNPPPDTSCYTCHVEQAPVVDNGIWHGTHGRSDCCAKCHGGNCSSMDKDLAHQGVVENPLSDIYTNCHSCHPDDYQAVADIFAGELGIQPGSIATPVPAPTGKVAENSLVILPSPVSRALMPGSAALIFGVVGLVFLLLAGMFLWVVHLKR